jgi:hypothetical protein
MKSNSTSFIHYYEGITVASNMPLLFIIVLIFIIYNSLPHVVFFYLDQYVFPEVLKHQSLKLSACGQELGKLALTFNQ